MTDLPDPASPEEDALSRHRDELRQRFPLPRLKPRKRSRSVVASLLLLLVAAGVVGIDPAYRTEQYATLAGERETWGLADGSRLTLDSDTRVVVSWHLRSRRVSLVHGQAMFDVTKSRLRAFRVQAGATEARVLGTLFSVSKSADLVRVALRRGAVSVSAGRVNQVRLIPGQQVEAKGHQLMQPQPLDDDAWINRKLVFNRTPLLEALQQIQGYRETAIVLDAPSLATMPISGVFDTSNVEALIALLPRILPVRLTTDADGTTRLQRAQDKK